MHAGEYASNIYMCILNNHPGPRKVLELSGQFIDFKNIALDEGYALVFDTRFLDVQRENSCRVIILFQHVCIPDGATAGAGPEFDNGGGFYFPQHH